MVLFVMNVESWGEQELFHALSALPEPLQEKALKRRELGGKALSAAASLLLDRALREETGLSLEEVKLQLGPHGKPYFAGAELQFSLSHSGCYAVCAAGKVPVGVDVEQIAPGKRDLTALARRFFHPEELRFLQESPTPTVDFFRLWTLKESYLKFTGEGLSRPLNSFCIRPGEESLSEGEGLLFTEWDTLPGYRLALCRVKTEEQISFRIFTE